MPPNMHARTPVAALEHKSAGINLIGSPDDQPGTIEAIVAVFNEPDRGDDRILPGFFAKSLSRKLPKGVWGHDWETPIAKTLEARELYPGDPALPESIRSLGGLYIKGQFNLDTQRGREAYSDIKFGTIDEFSFGYRATQVKKDAKTGVRDLIEGEIYEWSPVLAGMNERTRLISIKSSRGVEPASGKTFLDSSREMVSVIGEFQRRVKSRVKFRTERPRNENEKAGRVFSQANVDALNAVSAAMDDCSAELRSILSRATTKPASEPAPAKAEGSPVETTAEAPAQAEPAAPDIPVTTADPAALPAAGASLSDDALAAILSDYATTRVAATAALAGSLYLHA